MTGQIRILDESVINQIAAGESVSRPAAIIKELIENALDAGARRISITIQNAGVDLIVVEDDGVGMGSDDLRLCVTRHATSKIRSVKDLRKALSLGFRGEALASIAAVADLTIRSGRDGESYVMTCADGESSLRPAPFVQGTQVRVADLFRTVPARKKFLRHHRAEMLATQAVVRAVALSRPDVDVRLAEIRAQDTVTLIAYHPSIQDDRIQNAMGRAFWSTSVDLSGQDGDVLIEGRMSLPTGFTKTPGDIFIFVNGRAVRSAEVMRAVRSGFPGGVPADRHPQYALYINLPPEQVDVNVHPTKSEVRFADLSRITDLITRAVADHVQIAPTINISAPRKKADDIRTIQVDESVRIGDVILFREEGVLRVMSIDTALTRHMREGAVTDLAVPLIITPCPSAHQWIDDLSTLGFRSELFGAGALMIRTVPAGISADPNAIPDHIAQTKSPKQGAIRWAAHNMSTTDILSLGTQDARDVSADDVETYLKKRA